MPYRQPMAPIPETTSSSPQTVASWRFWAPLAIQLVLLGSVPVQSSYTYFTGTDVTLATAPVDPYDFLRGYYQVLNYQISNVEQLQHLPGGDFFNLDTEQAFYLVLEAPKDSEGSPPTPWQPVLVSGTRPQNLPPSQVAIHGIKSPRGNIDYGLEAYYMPEAQREAINQDIAQVQQQTPEAFVVDVKVDRRGNAVPIRLWVGDRNYQF